MATELDILPSTVTVEIGDTTHVIDIVSSSVSVDIQSGVQVGHNIPSGGVDGAILVWDTGTNTWIPLTSVRGEDDNTLYVDGHATGALADIDLQVGGSYGMVGMGNALFGRTNRVNANLDLDGTVILQNKANPAISNILFAMMDGTNSIRFAIPQSGVGNATYNPRSMLLAGPVPNDDAAVTVGYWQTNESIFHNLTCDTGVSGADLGVQGSLEVEVDIFTDSIKESTPGSHVSFDPGLISPMITLGNASINPFRTIHASQQFILSGAGGGSYYAMYNYANTTGIVTSAPQTTGGYFYGLDGVNASTQTGTIYGMQAYAVLNRPITSANAIKLCAAVVNSINVTPANTAPLESIGLEVSGSANFNNAVNEGYGIYVKNWACDAPISSGIKIDKQTAAVVNQGIWLNGNSAGADIVFGALQEASIYFDGFDLIIDAPAGGNNVKIGNFKFDVSQAMDLALDDYVLTYDHATGFITLEAAVGGTTTYTNATPMPQDIGGMPSGTTFNNDTLDSIFDRLFYPYVGPSVTLASAPQAQLREFGDDVVNPTLTATPIAGSDPITNIEFKRGALVIQSTPADPDVTDTFTVDANTTYTVTVDDGTSTDSDTETYTFVYPFYYGVGAAGLTAAQVAGLTKLVQNNGDKVLSFAPNNQVYYFAFPQAYGLLTRVLDWNGFDITADFTIRSENITGLDGTSQPYYIYEFDNLVTHSAQNLTFDT